MYTLPFAVRRSATGLELDVVDVAQPVVWYIAGTDVRPVLRYLHQQCKAALDALSLAIEAAPRKRIFQHKQACVPFSEDPQAPHIDLVVSVHLDHTAVPSMQFTLRDIEQGPSLGTFGFPADAFGAFALACVRAYRMTGPTQARILTQLSIVPPPLTTQAGHAAWRQARKRPVPRAAPPV